MNNTDIQPLIQAIFLRAYEDLHEPVEPKPSCYNVSLLTAKMKPIKLKVRFYTTKSLNRYAEHLRVWNVRRNIAEKHRAESLQFAKGEGINLILELMETKPANLKRMKKNFINGVKI
jgi:hypothetical protein